MKPPSSKLTFFRQSGWMVFATVAGGALMYAVHKAAGKMDPPELGEKPEYGVFTTMLQVLTQMTIPSIGLQMVVMRQTVAALSDPLRRQLSRALRSLLAGTFVCWLLAMAVAFVFRQQLVASFKMSNPATLWLTASWGLWVLWLPIFMGVLQGRQDFLWYGGASILGGLIRLLAVVAIVLGLGGQAAGACLAVLIQVMLATCLSGWLTREVWLGPGEPVAWGDWGKRILPLTIGPGVVIYMMSLDMIVVQYFFPEGQTGFYAAAGTIGRALVFLTSPLTAVMFPKVVASAAKSEKSDAMLLALGATALIGAGAAVACTLLPSLPLRIIYDASYLKVAWLVPWFAWCMLPLSLGAVLVNNLLARERYGVVPWLVVLALGYAGALAMVCQKHSSPLFTERSFKDLPVLARQLRGGADAVSKLVWERLGPETQRVVSGNSASPEARQAMAAALNRLIEGAPLHGSSLLATNDSLDLVSFAARLRNGTDPVARFLADRFETKETPLLANPVTSSGQPNPTLVHKLNTLLQSNSFFQAERFAGVQLSEETRRLLAQNPVGEAAVRLNRLLLEDAFSRDIGRSATYDVHRFDSVALSKTTQNLLAKRSTGAALVRLNRLLLEEAYPAEIVPMVRGFLPVVQTLGVFGLLLVAVSLGFTVRAGPHKPTQELPAPPVE